jgi:hypothetical protein
MDGKPKSYNRRDLKKKRGSCVASRERMNNNKPHGTADAMGSDPSRIHMANPLPATRTTRLAASTNHFHRPNSTAEDAASHGPTNKNRRRESNPLYLRLADLLDPKPTRQRSHVGFVPKRRGVGGEGSGRVGCEIVTSFLCSSSFCCSIWAASSSAVSSVILVSRWAGGDPAGGKREEEEEEAAAAAAKTLEWQADSRSLAQWGVCGSGALRLL